MKYCHLQNSKNRPKLQAPNYYKTTVARHTMQKSIQKRKVLSTIRNGAKEALDENAPNVTHTVISATRRAKTATRERHRREKNSKRQKMQAHKT